MWLINQLTNHNNKRFLLYAFVKFFKKYLENNFRCFLVFCQVWFESAFGSFGFQEVQKRVCAREREGEIVRKREGKRETVRDKQKERVRVGESK